MKKLSVSQIRKAWGREKPYRIGESGGLFLKICQLKNGLTRRYWYSSYTFKNKKTAMALGVFPEMSITEARIRHEEIQQQVASGIYPNSPRTHLLGESIVKSAEAREKPYTLKDGGGLLLYVQKVKKGAAKHWRYSYSFKEKSRTISLGKYPAISIAQARKRHQIAVNFRKNGIDPMDRKDAIECGHLSEVARGAP